MFAIVAVVLLALGAILDGARVATTSAWLSPQTLGLLGLALLALHVATGGWPRH